VLAQPEIEAAIVGVNSLREFDEVLSAALSLREKLEEIPEITVPVDSKFLDPSVWPARPFPVP
jgi:hypothetical protein